MPPPESSAGVVRRPTLVVANPSGNRTRVVLEPVPFTIGRHPENNLVLRDTRISRNHARIMNHNGQFLLEDLNSRHGVFVNGERIERRPLRNSDRIDFGFQDSYRITFSVDEGDLNRILDQLQPPAAAPGPSNLGKLRALVEVARALQSSLSIDDVLAAVVDAALAVTGTERGFLLLRDKQELEVKVAREKGAIPLSNTDLKVPTSVIQRALRQRRELLSMSFDPLEEQGARPNTTIANLELRSVVCVPLVRVRSGGGGDETMVSSLDDTVGLLYMDSRETHADLSSGNRELLQTLALEASTILENARLLEEERAKQRIEEELDIARQIQTSLLPTELPSSGWFRAAGSSIPSHQVGGDYFDLREISPDAWSVVVADVSGKGVSSALLASFLQGAFLLASDAAGQIPSMMGRMNRYLLERTKGEKYATVFYGIVERRGVLHSSNAGHCAPMVVQRNGRVTTLATTGLPIGMLEEAQYALEELRLAAGDKIIIYSDGLTEAQDPEDRFFGLSRLRKVLEANAGRSCAEIHRELLNAVDVFAEGTMLADDVTVVVIEYAPDVI